MPTRKSTKRKALLAIVFAGGMLNSPLPALSENKVESTNSVIQGIDNNAQIEPEVKAYFLLKLASNMLDGSDWHTVEAQYRSFANAPSKIRSWESLLVYWSDYVAGHKAEPMDAHLLSDENRALTNTAIKIALVQLDKSSNKFARLNLYFIAADLFQKMGNADGVRKCNKVLDAAFKSVEEKNSPVDEEAIRAASSILNSMAYGFVPIRIPEGNLGLHRKGIQSVQEILSFPEKDFEESEKLKLRAATMLDRLSPKNHLRRMAHRDLTLWYMQLGKTAMADREKQILFELVGSNDDRLLYPQSVGCGHFTWWQTDKRIIAAGCGMG